MIAKKENMKFIVFTGEILILIKILESIIFSKKESRKI